VNDYSQGKGTRLLDLLEQEIELFRQIHELTQKQSQLLEQDEASAFNSSLDSRLELIEKINGLHQELDVLMQSYMSFAGSGIESQADAVEKAIAHRRGIIAACAELNKKNTALAKEKAEDYIKRIGKLRLKRKSIELYTPDIPDNAELFDRKT